MLLLGLASPVYADAWDWRNSPTRFEMGTKTVAHELTHVVQQAEGRVYSRPDFVWAPETVKADDSQVWNQPIMLLKSQDWDLDGKGTDNVVEEIELAIETIIRRILTVYESGGWMKIMKK